MAWYSYVSPTLEGYGEMTVLRPVVYNFIQRLLGITREEDPTVGSFLAEKGVDSVTVIRNTWNSSLSPEEFPEMFLSSLPCNIQYRDMRTVKYPVIRNTWNSSLSPEEFPEMFLSSLPCNIQYRDMRTVKYPVIRNTWNLSLSPEEFPEMFLSSLPCNIQHRDMRTVKYPDAVSINDTLPYDSNYWSRLSPSQAGAIVVALAFAPGAYPDGVISVESFFDHPADFSPTLLDNIFNSFERGAGPAAGTRG